MYPLLLNNISEMHLFAPRNLKIVFKEFVRYLINYISEVFINKSKLFLKTCKYVIYNYKYINCKVFVRLVFLDTAENILEFLKNSLPDFRTKSNNVNTH